MKVSATATATGQATAASLIMVPALLLIDRPWSLAPPAPGVIAAIIGLVVLSIALAHVLHFRILDSAGATNLLLVTFLVPVSATILGVAVLGEILALRHILGMGLIAAGLAALDRRVLRRR